MPIQTNNDNYNDNYIDIHTNAQQHFVSIIRERRSYVVCHFKCVSSLKSGGFWLVVNVSFFSWKKNHSKKVIPTI